MILNSLKSRIVLTTMGILALSLSVITYSLVEEAKKELTNSINQNALNILDVTKGYIESQHNNILKNQGKMLSLKRRRVKNKTILAHSLLKHYYQDYLDGRFSEQRAKQLVIKEIVRLRMSEDIGHFWINDTSDPYPKIIMHTEMTKLAGTVADGEYYGCAGNIDTNVFRLAVSIGQRQGEGHIDCNWPSISRSAEPSSSKTSPLEQSSSKPSSSKPNASNLSDVTNKMISFAKIFKPWGWIVGNTVSIGDIDKYTNDSLHDLITDTNKILEPQRIGQDGYFFIFKGDGDVLLHPVLAGKSAISLKNPVTGNSLFNDLKETAKTKERFLQYVWDRPEDKGNYVYKKRAHVLYYQPLDWYIASSIYQDDLEHQTSALMKRAKVIFVVLIAISLMLSWFLIRSITKPLNKLVDVIRDADTTGIPTANIPEDNLEEIQVLSTTMNSMISRIKSYQNEIVHLRNYMSDIIDSMPLMLVGVDVTGKITQWNKTAEIKTGIQASQANGKLLNEVLPYLETEIEKIEQSIKLHKSKQTKISCQKQEGYTVEEITIYPLESGGIEGAVILINDISEKVRMQEMMIQSEKMLSIAGLAAGMAHEINNPLAGMMQTASVISNRLFENIDMPANKEVAARVGTTVDAIKRFMEEREIPRMLTSINQSGKRAAVIINNMLSFARKDDEVVAAAQINEIIHASIELAETDYHLKKHYDFKKISLDADYGENLPDVYCEQAQIQQVIFNLLRNSAQALQESKTQSPKIVIKTSLNREKNKIVIEVEDNGPGMAEDVRKRVFDPFFTTKPTGLGTGLGLSVSYYIIVEEHGGEMFLHSNLGNGAKFTITLPLMQHAHGIGR